MDKPRIILLTDSYWPVVGGGETHARLVSATLHNLGTKITILTQNKIKGLPEIDYLDNVPIYRFGIPGLVRFGKYLMIPSVFVWLIRHRKEYDLIYCCGLRTLGFPAVLIGLLTNRAILLRSESCEELSGEYILEQIQPGNKIAKLFIKAVLHYRNKVLKKADSFMAISTAIATEYRKCGVPDEKTALVFNGIDLSIFDGCSDKDNKQNLRKLFNLPEEKTIFTYTGKLNRGKGLEHLLVAFKYLVESRPSIHLLLVGSGQHMHLSMEDELRSYIENNGLINHVTFTGYQDNVQEYLQASDIFVMPSEMEALCISLIEAIACGLPSIASDVGGIPDVARNNRDALLIPPGDWKSLADAMSRLLDDPVLASALAQAGRQRIKERFDINNVANQHLDLFSQIASKKFENTVKA